MPGRCVWQGYGLGCPAGSLAQKSGSEASPLLQSARTPGVAGRAVGCRGGARLWPRTWCPGSSCAWECSGKACNLPGANMLTVCGGKATTKWRQHQMSVGSLGSKKYSAPSAHSLPSCSYKRAAKLTSVASKGPVATQAVQPNSYICAS
eukprot:1153109-Pelagomonas_calceolata.AAC.3